MRLCNEKREFGTVRCCNSVLKNGILCCGDLNKTDDRSDCSKEWCSMLCIQVDEQLSFFD